jgi:transcriptional regulator with GAF, ATPase, and Fis domain
MRIESRAFYYQEYFVMNENKRTKKEIIDELIQLRRDITGLESTAARYKHYEEELDRQQKAFKIHFDFEEEIANLQMNHIVGEALDFIKDRIDVSRVSIAILDKEQEGLRLLDVREDKDTIKPGHFLPFESTVLSEVVRLRKPVYRPDLREVRHKYDTDFKFIAAGLRSDLLIPLILEGECVGTLNMASKRVDGISEDDRCSLTLLARPLAQALRKAQLFEEIIVLKKQIELENEYLREELNEVRVSGEIIGQSPAILNVIKQIDLVAPTEASVLILGESGTGKELVAREIHRRSLRKDRPMVKVNCATIPRELYESEFFGHIKGSFTGAIKDRAGRFEIADGGTIFLDEVGEIPLDLQSKLLRVIQEGEYERVGEEKTRKVNVRIISATNLDLKQAVEEKRFREDLYYRLNVFPIEVAPLRVRKDDIPLLAANFVEKTSSQLHRPQRLLTRANIIQLQSYDWPGNVRELQNVCERSVITSRTKTLHFDLPVVSVSHDSTGITTTLSMYGDSKGILTETEIRRLEMENIQRALRQSKWKIYGDGGAAEMLGLRPTTLIARINKMGIKRQSKG